MMRSGSAIMIVVTFLLATKSVTSDTPNLPDHRGIPIENLRDPLYEKLAVFAVSEYNKENPKSEPLKFVTLDRGYWYTEADYQFLELFITASNHLGQAKYLAKLIRVYFKQTYDFFSLNPVV
ncbi:hypothetical protein LINPERPRIM_LOCUS26479 [Linum perenne]